MGAEFETNIHCVRQLMFASFFPLTTTTAIIAPTFSDLQKFSHTIPLPSTERRGPVQSDSVLAKKKSAGRNRKGGPRKWEAKCIIKQGMTVVVLCILPVLSSPTMPLTTPELSINVANHKRTKCPQSWPIKAKTQPTSGPDHQQQQC